MDVANTDTLTYDPARRTYRHDLLAECSFRKDAKMSTMEICDPLTYNNKEPGLSNKYRWLPAGHRWGVFLGEGGRVYRHPISQSLNLEGQNCWTTATGYSYWVLVPDRAVCPVWEHLMPREKMYIGVCHWGYDWHQLISWQDRPRTFKAGEKYTVHYAMTGWTPKESEERLLVSALHPQNDQPEPPGKRFGFLQVPSMLAYPVVEPAGTSFDKLVNTRVPYIGWQWCGDYSNDCQVGRTDRYSMRLDGPASVHGQFYHHMLDGNAKRYLCTFWLKTQGVKGSAPTAILRYPWNEKVPKDVIDTGLTGNNDWTEISFITRMPVVTAETYDTSEFILQCKGTGTVWLDDWSVRPLGDNERITEKRPAPGPVPALHPSPDYLLDLPCREGAGPSCFDVSGHLNNLKLHGVNWISAGNRPVLHFDGKSSCPLCPSPRQISSPRTAAGTSRPGSPWKPGCGQPRARKVGQCSATVTRPCCSSCPPATSLRST